MRKAELCLIDHFGDLKDNLTAVPFRLIFNKGQMAVQHMPYDFLASCH